MQKLEPYVEVTQRNKVVTDDCPVFDIDLQTCTKEDLDFSSKYEVKAVEKCYVNMLCAWFDVFFSFGDRRVKLTTSTFFQITLRSFVSAYSLETDFALS